MLIKQFKKLVLEKPSGDDWPVTTFAEDAHRATLRTLELVKELGIRVVKYENFHLVKVDREDGSTGDMNFEKPLTIEELRKIELTRFLSDTSTPKVVGQLLATIATRDATIERLTEMLVEAHRTPGLAEPGWHVTSDGFARSDFVRREDGYDQGACVSFDGAAPKPWRAIYRRGSPQGTTADGPYFAISNYSYASAIEAMRDTDIRHPTPIDP